jgi:hypothetical protein
MIKVQSPAFLRAFFFKIGLSEFLFVDQKRSLVGAGNLRKLTLRRPKHIFLNFNPSFLWQLVTKQGYRFRKRDRLKWES